MKNLKVKLRKQTFYSITNNKMFGNKFNKKKCKNWYFENYKTL